MKRTCLLLLAVVCFLLGSGCNGGPAPIPATRFNVKRCVAKALEIHDADADGSISASELESSPGLSYAAKRADSSGDGALDKAELAAMVEAWNEKSTGLIEVRGNVSYKKRPLQGAAVRLEPEPFLEGIVEMAVGVSDEFGDFYLSVPKDKRPIADAPPGVQLGLYRVVVSKSKDGNETLPSKYNTETVLGQEVSFGDPGVSNGMVRLELK